MKYGVYKTVINDKIAQRSIILTHKSINLLFLKSSEKNFISIKINIFTIAK